MSKKSLKKPIPVSTATQEDFVDTYLSETFNADQINDCIHEFYPDYVTVLGKFRVNPYWYELAAMSLETIEDFLVEGKEYSPQELIGETEWVSHSETTQRELELCLKHFATLSECPLQDTFGGSFTWGKASACA